MSRIGPRGTGTLARRAPDCAARLFGQAAVAASHLYRRAPFAAAILCLLSGDITAEEKPPSALDWGFRLRLRQEYQANVYDFSEASADDYNYLRVRSQLWGSWAPAAQWKLYAMLNNEHRRWYKSNKGLEDQPFEIHELLFENLSIEGKNIGGTPFGFVLGRQNLFYGEGFVCWDGGPLDGSRTAYFNALLLTAAFGKRRLEAHVISNPEQDEYLPVFNDQDQPLIEWEETGAGLYYTDESFEGRKLEAYYFFKNEKDGDGVYPENDIHTIGARASGKGFERFTFAVEGAVQFGTSGSNGRLGAGGYLTAKYRLPVERTPLSLSAGSIYLSGDNGRSDDEEGWNPLYSRWPKWSELFIYTLAKESHPAFWQNLASGWFGLDFTPVTRCTLEGRLYLMWAPAATWETCGPDCHALPRELTDEFAYRGTLSTVKLKVRANEYLDGHLLWEMLQPGEFYGDAGDAAHFLRWEILFNY